MAKKQKQGPVNKSVQGQVAAKPASAVSLPKASKPFSIRNVYILLAVLTFALYANTMQNGYVMDDVIVLKENKIVMKGISAIPELFRTPHMYGYMVIPNDMYRPLSMAMFAVEFQFFGANPVVNHFFNILVFIGCVLMFFLFVSRLFDGKRVGVAFIAALLFALHPIHTEVVANVKSRDELLCFFFAFWSLCLFMSYMSSGKIVKLVLGLLMLFLSYLSKETVITFLAVIPLLFFVYKNEDKKRAVFITVGSMVVTGIFLAIRASVLSTFHANEPASIDFIDNALVKAPDTLSRIATEVVIMGRYLWLQFIPYPLLSTYSFSAIPFATLGSTVFWLSLLAYLGLGYVAVTRFIKDKKDPWVFAILFFVITLSLFSNIPFLMGAEMAERFAFFASVSVCIAGALAIEKWVIKAPAADVLVLKSTKMLAVLVPLLLIFGGMTIARNADWKDNYTLYNADLKKSPENARLYHYIATAMAEENYQAEPDSMKRKQMDVESVGYLKKALQIYPDFTEAHVELGRIYDRNHQYDSAIAEDRKALAVNPNHSTANNNLGGVYLTTGKYRDAVFYLRRSIAVNPGFPLAYINLARTYGQLQQPDSAIIYYNQYLVFAPGDFNAQQELGIIYFSKQQYNDAEVYFKAAMAIKPNDANVINSLGATYLNSKKYPQAIEVFKKAVALSPNYINGISNLGRAYYLNGQYAPALEVFNKEMAIDPRSPRDLPYMALCYEKMGNMAMARQYEVVAKKAFANFKLE